MRSYKDIQNVGRIAMDDAIFQAYNAGLSEGRREAEELRAKMAAILGTPMMSPGEIATVSVGDMAIASDQLEASVVPRVTPGTVKPGILKIIHETPSGITTKDIIARTGFKPNSVRGTLSTLATENAIAKQGDLWFSAERIIEMAKPVDDADGLFG